jgi:DNA-binding MarR family transcriptional regulator
MQRADSEDDIDLIARAVTQLGRRLRAARAARSLTLSALGMLSSLERHGPMSAAALARREGLAPQSLSRLLASLSAADQIVRRPDDKDHRAWIIDITSEGRLTLARDGEARRAWLDTAMAGALTPLERRALVKAAEIMLRVAGDAN